MRHKMLLLRLSKWAIPFALVLALSASGTTSQSVHSQGGGCVAPPPGLVSWWPGDGNAQDIADGNNGTLQGGTSFGAGVVGQAFSFDGFDDFITAGNPPNLRLSTSDFTVDAWVNFDSLFSPPGSPSWPCASAGCDMSIVNKMMPSDFGGPNRDGWRLFKQYDDNQFWFCLGVGSNGCSWDGSTTVQSNTIPVPGVWYHVAGVKSSLGIFIYVNGALEASKPLPSFVDTDSADVLIGYYPQESFMYGRIDEVEIFNRALNASEIQQIFQAGSAGKCKSAPVGGIAEFPSLEPEAAVGGADRHGASLPPVGPTAIAGLLALASAAAGWYVARRTRNGRRGWHS